MGEKLIKKKIVIGLSGGMDSTTLLGLLLSQKYEIHCCSFIYGSTHNKYENKATIDVVNYYKSFSGHILDYHIMNITKIMRGFSSSLLKSCNQEIPEGSYNDENMKKTVVPGRNLIFASIMAGLAESIGAEKIALGVHQGDHFIYPDCRPVFIHALDVAIHLSSDQKVRVITPFENMDKKEILEIGYSLDIPVPYHLTRTCYKNQPISCGKCGSCRERLEAFHAIGKEDSIIYEKGNKKND